MLVEKCTQICTALKRTDQQHGPELYNFRISRPISHFLIPSSVLMCVSCTKHNKTTSTGNEYQHMWVVKLYTHALKSEMIPTYRIWFHNMLHFSTPPCKIHFCCCCQIKCTFQVLWLKLMWKSTRTNTSQSQKFQLPCTFCTVCIKCVHQHMLMTWGRMLNEGKATNLCKHITLAHISHPKKHTPKQNWPPWKNNLSE